MRYIFDHDMHIHSYLSLCSGDPAQNKDAILQYAKDNGIKTLCLTDHFWDEAVPGAENFEFYSIQNLKHVSQSLPLPQADGIRFLFGCETDLKEDLTLGIAPEHFDVFDFIIIPTTHMHMSGFTCRGDETAEESSDLWFSRFHAVLDMDLPFHKIGIAHLTDGLMAPHHHLETLRLLDDRRLTEVFAKAQKKGVGIELNFDALSFLKPENEELKDLSLHVYRIAKSCGCKFYLGSDAHHNDTLAVQKQNAETIIDFLDLQEDEKFIL